MDGAEIDPESQKFMEELTDHLREVSKTMTLDTYLADIKALDKASDELIRDDLALLTIGYVLIIMYANVVLFRNSCLACKTHLSIVSVVAIGLALISAFGMAQTFGVKVCHIMFGAGGLTVSRCGSSIWSFTYCRF